VAPIPRHNDHDRSSRLTDLESHLRFGDTDGDIFDAGSRYLPNNGLFNWDLNIQMTWWSVAGANRLQLMQPLTRFLQRNVHSFCDNVVPAARPGCTGSHAPPTLAGPSAHTGYVAVGRIEVGHGDPVSPAAL
jgi:hypothetical protein